MMILSLNIGFPTYTFTRIDSKDALVSPGYNFRYSRYYSENGKEFRDLFKAYGIRFEILTSGSGKRFSAVQLAINVGSGIGLLAIATLVCDIVLLYFTSGKKTYQAKKYLYVIDSKDQKISKAPSYGSTEESIE